MEELSVGNSGRPNLQRYALRSSSKVKENNPDVPNSSDSKRGLNTPRVSKSVVGLDFSGKDKSTSAKPPRRLSNPIRKTSATPNSKLVGNITPISEARAMRSGNGQGPRCRSQTPASDISRTSGRKKFNLISSSYWLNQIKLSESATMHSISLGLFKLALEARCEPFQKIEDELKSYAKRHELAGLGEQVNELLQSYGIAEYIEQPQPQVSENISLPQVSESISQVPEEGGRSSGDELLCCSSSIMDTAKPKPECFDTESTQLAPATTESTKKETSQKNNPGSRLRENLKKNSANSKSASDSGSYRSVKKSQKQTQQQPNKEKSEVKKQGKKSDLIIKVPTSPSPAEDNNTQGNKENMDVQTTEEISLTEVA
ncbi:hypothetical protein Fmac_026340 [Flemingia macrophylla]|uniref:Uncharacterized protein n=1 Tax=Flemingia macrophylla TaxID=520843 RepID=A0ABD1LEQ4_9FABA